MGCDLSDLTIWTIGHSTRCLEEFISLLQRNEIGVIADVRSHPGSRKFPQFDQEALKASLTQVGIELIWFKKLGGRKRARKDSPNTVWRNVSFRGYADYMETDEFEEGINELIAVARERRTALMCSEAVWWRCHRSMISDHLKAAGATVFHIVGESKAAEHPYTSAASVVDGQLTYGRAGSE